jgi:hypothetical protein
MNELKTPLIEVQKELETLAKKYPDFSNVEQAILINLIAKSFIEKPYFKSVNNDQVKSIHLFLSEEAIEFIKVIAKSIDDNWSS